MRIIWEQDDFPEDKVFASKVAHPAKGRKLGVSIYCCKRGGIVTHKTCPYCSKRAGRYVWRLMETYHYRVTDGGVVPQARCSECRSKRSR